MTSVLLLKGPDRLVAVADGRLTVGEQTVRTNEAEKLRLFTPRYHLPKISMNRFHNFVEVTERDWCVAYAGTYALASLTIDQFVRAINGGLYLDRDGRDGSPVFVDHFDTGAQYMDEFNFTEADRRRLGAYEISSEFLKVAERRFKEWVQSGDAPDCEFLLFGLDGPTNEFHAFKIQMDLDHWKSKREVVISLTAVQNGEIAAIGSPSVKAAIAGDEELRVGVRGWRDNHSAKAMDKAIDGFDLDRAFEAGRNYEEPVDDEDWLSDKVIQRFAHTMIKFGDHTVGGQFTVAQSYWNAEIRVSNIEFVDPKKPVASEPGAAP